MQSPIVKSKHTSTSLAGVAPLGAACLWGGMYVVSKIGFAAIPPITLGLLRLLVGGGVLWIALWLSNRLRPASRPRFTASQKWRLLLLGLCIAGTLVTQFMGTNLATAHEGALLTTITPVFIIPIAWFLLRERPRWRTVLGMLIALVGVILVVGIPGSSDARHGQALFGDVLLIISALMWALFTVLGTPLVRSTSALVVSTYGTLWAICFLAPLALWELTQQPVHALSWSVVGSVLYLGIGATALAWFLWYKGVERLPASVAAIFFFAQPVVGGLLSALLLHEVLGWSFWFGGFVLTLGIVLSQDLQGKDV